MRISDITPRFSEVKKTELEDFMTECETELHFEIKEQTAQLTCEQHFHESLDAHSKKLVL